MHTLEDFYQFLLSHNLVNKVLQYRKLYTRRSVTHICTRNPLIDLFEWDGPSEGSAYWNSLFSEYRMEKFTPTSIANIMLYLRTRRTQPEQPYEFW